MKLTRDIISVRQGGKITIDLGDGNPFRVGEWRLENNRIATYLYECSLMWSDANLRKREILKEKSRVRGWKFIKGQNDYYGGDWTGESKLYYILYYNKANLVEVPNNYTREEVKLIYEDPRGEKYGLALTGDRGKGYRIDWTANPLTEGWDAPYHNI